MSIENLKNPPKYTSHETHRLLCISSKEGDSQEFNKFSDETYNSHSLSEVRTATKAIVNLYNDRRKRDAQGHMALAANNEFVKGVLHVGALAAAPATLGASLTLEGVNYGMGKLMDTTLDLYDEKAKAASLAFLSSSLKALRQQGADINLLKNIDFDSDDPEKVSARKKTVSRILKASSPTIPTIDLNGIDESGRPFLNHHVIEQLKGVIKRNDDLNKFVDIQQQQDIKKLQTEVEQVGKMGASLLKMQEESSVALRVLNGGVMDINKKIGQLSAQVGDNTEGIAYLKELMYGKMTPEEQLAAVNSGEFKLSDEAAKKALEISVARRNLVRVANKYLNGASVIANFAGQIGLVDPKTLAEINKIASTGTALVNGFSALSSGNYIAAVSALGSLVGIFGKKGQDVATQRHKQIMQRFDALEKGQEQIMKNQKALMEGQQKIHSLQLETYNALISTGRHIDERFNEMMEKLAKMHEDILVNRGLIVELLNEDLNAGHHFLRDREPVEGEPPNGFNVATGQFDSFEAMQEHFRKNTNFDNYKRGSKAIEDLRVSDGEIDSRLLLEAYKERGGVSTSTNAEEYSKQVHKRTLDLAYIYKNPPELYASLLSPVEDVSYVDKKSKVLKPHKLSGEQSVVMRKNIERPLSTDAVLKACELIIGMQPYYQLVDGSEHGKLYDSSDIEKKRSLDNTGLKRLKEAVSVVDLAIAQQGLVAGDSLLPNLSEEVKAAQTIKPEVDHGNNYLFVTEALDSNGLLRRNLAMYLAHRAVYSSDGANKILSYYNACGLSDPVLLHKIFGDDFEFSHEPDKKYENPWVILLPKYRGKKESQADIVRLRLPSSDKLQHGKIEYQQDMHELIGLRDRMVDAIMGYELFDDLDGSEKKVYLDLNIVSAGKK